MKHIYFFSILIFSVLNINKTYAQTVWTGTTTTFTKGNNVDWTLEANQDRITDNVWITRQNNKSIFNIKLETNPSSNACLGVQPSDTEWAYGTTANYSTLTYEPFSDLISCEFKTFVDGQDMVLHLISDDIYIDIKFTAWTTGGSGGTGAGGGFTYERSTDQTLSSNNFELNKKMKIFPNPATDFIQILGLNEKANYIIYNVIGSEINKGIISNDNKIYIENLRNGMYFLRLEGRNTIKFIKE